jgi:uncharacterized protein YjiS (DUF1127 family)
MTPNRRERDVFAKRAFAPANLAAAGPAAALRSMSALPPISLGSAAQHALVRAVETISAWHDRARQRRALMALSNQMLRDIGISRAEAQGEATRPFWRG